MPTILLLLVLQTQVTGSPIGGPQPTGSIAGVVRDTAGHPLADAVISIAVGSRRVRTDSLGRYHMDGVPVGPVDLMAWAYRHKTMQTDTVVRRGEELHVDFVLHPLFNEGVIPAGAVFGVVRDTAGRPVPGVSLFIGGLPRAAGTDSLGQYHFDWVPVGPARVVARRLGYKSVWVDTTIVTGQQLWVDFVLHTQAVKIQYIGVRQR